MGIKRFIFAAVLQLDGDTVRAEPASDLDLGIAGGADRSSAGRAEIDAGMHLVITQERMPAHAIARGQLEAGDRRLEQRLGG